MSAYDDMVDFLQAVSSLNEHNPQDVRKLIELKIAWDDYRKRPNLFEGLFPSRDKDMIRDIDRAFRQKLG